MSSLASVQQQLESLRESFTSNLPHRIAELDRAWEAASQSEQNQESMKVLSRLAHTLAGSAGTFGHQDVGLTARKVELLLQPCIERGLALQSDQREAIALQLKTLHTYEVRAHQVRHSSENRVAEPALVAAGVGEGIRPICLVRDGAHPDQLAEQLGFFGYSVQILCGVEGLAKKLSESSPMAVIVDSDHLPIEMHSKRLSQIRGNDGARIPIVFVSSQEDLSSRLNAARSGANAYFVKPVNVSRLVDRLDRLTSPHVVDPYRILIVEDDSILAQSYALTLQQAGMQTNILADPNFLLHQMSDWKPDLILMDLNMPEFTGTELAEVIRQQEDFVGIPIVYLSAETRVEMKMAAMSLGADDFLTKPIQPDHLISSVRSRAQRSHALRSLIMRDGLTGLLNHTTLKVQLEIQMERAKRKNVPLAYAMIDLDSFKSVNDTYGHPTGDGVIKTLGRILQQRLRKTDIIGRYGGEEFAVILPETNTASAKKVVDEIRVAFSQIPQQSQGAEFNTTFSAGVAAWPEFDTAIQLNDAADCALYQAKQSGRNNVALATASGRKG